MAEEAGPRRLRLARDALLLLAQDLEASVRAALADALADLPDAPRGLVLALARDAALEVCEPLIRLSRVLTEEDLEALVEEPPGPHTRQAVARRLHLPARIAQGLARCGDPAALLALLRNGTARLEADLLAALAGRAAILPWLPEALTARPGLPPSILQSLLPQLTQEAMDRLLRRPDLPPGTLAALRERVAKATRVWGD